MLKRIELRNFSLLRNVAVDLHPQLTVLTGASGAGKSLLFDAVAFGLGGRPHRTLLAEGASRCEVCLVLELDSATAQELGQPWQAGENLLVRRYTASGRGRITLNGEQAAIAQISAAGERLFEITGQFESRVLFNAATHIDLLDAFGDAALDSLLAEYRQEYRRWRELSERLQALRETAGQREQEIEFLMFQVDELSKADVGEGERAATESNLKLLKNAQALIQAADSAARLLDGDDDQPGAFDLAAQAGVQISELARLLEGAEVAELDPEELSELGEGIMAGLRDLAGRLRDIAESIQHDPAGIERLGERLDLLLRLERKYGCAADDLPQLLRDKEQRLAYLTDDTQSPEALEHDVKSAAARVRELAGKLTQKRRSAAKRLEKLSLEYFKELDFPHVELQVDIGAAEQPGPQGLDQVELLVSLNPGEPARALARVASGGEASRLMLGIKAALAGQLGHSVLLLDEIEAGIGGDTGRRVAGVLAELARQRQVLAITHLPSVAAQGDLHLVARKSVTRGTTAAEIVGLSGEERRQELTRMLGDEAGDEEQALVDKLLEQAAK
jgi:DNA repair protein RecN (Recombination protein N)